MLWYAVQAQASFFSTETRTEFPLRGAWPSSRQAVCAFRPCRTPVRDLPGGGDRGGSACGTAGILESAPGQNPGGKMDTHGG